MKIIKIHQYYQDDFKKDIKINILFKCIQKYYTKNHL